jgi:hypothetical protein
MATNRASPLDLVLVYLTPSDHGIGQRLSIPKIDQRLGQLPLRPVLELLAIAAHRADRSITGIDERLTLARDLLREGRTRTRALAMISSGPLAVASAQQVLALALRALRACPDDARPVPADLRFRVGDLLVAMGDHLSERRGETNDELLLETVRSGLFYRLQGIGDWYSTAHDVFFDIIPTLSADPEFIDPSDVVSRHLGLSLGLLWALNASVGIAVMGDPKVQVFPKKIGEVTEDLALRWHEANTQTVEEARQSCIEDLESGSPWSFTTFFLRPILKIEPERHMPMRPQFLALKATVIGMYQIVFDLLKLDGADQHLRWSRFFGRAVEAYGRRLFLELLPDSPVISFPDDRPASAQAEKACDVLLTDGDAVIALDFVHRVLTLSTQTHGSPADLDKDLKLAILEKIDQIDTTLRTALAADNSASRIFAVVVMSGPLPMTPIAESHIAGLVATGSREVVGIDPRCRPIAVLELYELKMLLRTASDNQLSISDVLDSWLQSSFGGNNFRDWLLSQSQIEPGRSVPGDSWESLAFSIFRRAGSEQ